ncbi:MAG: DUF5058 family protein [Clostridium sp.]
MDYMKIAEHPLMWIAAGIAVGWAVFQSAIFVKQSIKTGREIGVTDDQMKRAIRSSMISSIGPSFVILVGMISLLNVVGGPTAWMRLSLIGSVSHELMAAQFAANSMGVTLGSPEFKEAAFAVAVWVMALGAVAWPLFTGLFAHKIESVRTKISGGNSGLLGIISSAASLGAFAFLVGDNLVTDQVTKISEILNFNSYTLACVLGALVMGVIMVINKKLNKAWLREWALSIAMFGSMIVTALIG